MSDDARAVVAAYLRDNAERNKPTEQRDLVGKRTREIVDELPDGFTKRDVLLCVKTLTADEPLLDDMTHAKRTRAVTKTLADMVADDELKLEGSLYYHAPIT